MDSPPPEHASRLKERLTVIHQIGSHIDTGVELTILCINQLLFFLLTIT